MNVIAFLGPGCPQHKIDTPSTCQVINLLPPYPSSPLHLVFLQRGPLVQGIVRYSGRIVWHDTHSCTQSSVSTKRLYPSKDQWGDGCIIQHIHLGDGGICGTVLAEWSYTATSLNADEPRVELAKWRVGAKRKMERERERESAKLLCFGSLSSLSVCKTITVYIKQHPRVGPVI